MSRFFDVLKKSESDRESVESSFSLGEMAPDDAGEDTDIDLIPVETVEVQPESRLVVYTDPRSPAADRFRFLRMHLRELASARRVKTLLITSPMPQDGKSTIALNLATTLSEEGRWRVLLIEADLHHPSVTARLKLKPGPGLAECLESDFDPLQALRRIAPLGWYLLPAGQPRANPTELLQSEPCARLVQRLSRHFDWILVDSPPVRPLTDALSLKRQADGTLVVARAGCTAREAVDETIALLGREHVIGVILNGVEGLNRLYSTYHGYYSR